MHQDGLVHISMLSHQFIKDPHSVVKAGDIVTVKVMEVDAARKRIALSMRLDDVPGQESKVSSPNRPAAKQPSPSAPAQNGTMAALFNQAMQKETIRLYRPRSLFSKRCGLHAVSIYSALKLAVSPAKTNPGRSMVSPGY